MTGRNRWLTAAALVLTLSGAAFPASAQTGGAEIPLDGKTEASLQEVARQVRNPIGPLWQLTFDHQVEGQGGAGLSGVEASYAGSFEPQVPVPLARLGLARFAWAGEAEIVTRLTVPFFETTPLPPGSGGHDRASGIGDIQLGGVIAPTRRRGWLGGLGPTFIFPSASDDALGQGKWQAGPAAVAGYLGKSFTAYVLAQQWWSFAGDRDRPDASQLALDYVLLRNLPGRWLAGMQPSLAVDWQASRGNRVAFPVGLGVGRTFRIGPLPVQLWLEADYYAVRPDDLAGPRWGIDFQITPVLR